LIKKQAAELARKDIPGLRAKLRAVIGDNADELIKEKLRIDAKLQKALAKIDRWRRSHPLQRGPRTTEGRWQLLEAAADELERQIGPPRKRVLVVMLQVLHAWGVKAPRLDQKYPLKAAARAAKEPSKTTA
jgi:hypothetical protein